MLKNKKLSCGRACINSHLKRDLRTHLHAYFSRSFRTQSHKIHRNLMNARTRVCTHTNSLPLGQSVYSEQVCKKEYLICRALNDLPQYDIKTVHSNADSKY